jgi:hypothetical protein
MKQMTVAARWLRQPRRYQRERQQHETGSITRRRSTSGSAVSGATVSVRHTGTGPSGNLLNLQGVFHQRRSRPGDARCGARLGCTGESRR